MFNYIIISKIFDGYCWSRNFPKRIRNHSPLESRPVSTCCKLKYPEGTSFSQLILLFDLTIAPVMTNLKLLVIFRKIKNIMNVSISGNVKKTSYMSFYIWKLIRIEIEVQVVAKLLLSITLMLYIFKGNIYV